MFKVWLCKNARICAVCCVTVVTTPPAFQLSLTTTISHLATLIENPASSSSNGRRRSSIGCSSHTLTTQPPFILYDHCGRGAKPRTSQVKSSIHHKRCQANHYEAEHHRSGHLFRPQRSTLAVRYNLRPKPPERDLETAFSKGVQRSTPHNQTRHCSASSKFH